MSTLSKVFVVLVFTVALFKLGVDATLFGQRVDWKDKFVKETNYHYQTQTIKNAEIADLTGQIDNLNNYNQKLKEKIDALDNERNSLGTRIAELTRQNDAVQANLQKLTATLEVQVRQLDVQMTQIQEMSNKVTDYQHRLAKARSEQLTAVQELQYVRQESERLSKDLASLEDNHQALAREKSRLQEIMAELSKRGVTTDLNPGKIIEAKVTAVDANLGLVIISVGRDDGVLEGTEYTIYRGSSFIAKIAIDKVDRKWSAARVTLKTKEDPRVSDDVTNNVLTSTYKAGN